MTRRRPAVALASAAVVTAALAAVVPATAANAIPIAPFQPTTSGPAAAHLASPPRHAASRVSMLRRAELQRSRFRPDVALRSHRVRSTDPVLRGTVVDVAGNPLDGVEIYSGSGSYATTSYDGTYRLHLAPGQRRVSFDGSSATTLGLAGTGYIGVRRTFKIGTPSVQATPTVLAAGAKVTGRVVDAQGHALRYATMSVLPIGQDSPYVDAADDEGSYSYPVNFDVVESHASGRFDITGADAGSALVCFGAQELEGIPTGGSAGNYGYQSVCSSRPVALVPGQTVNVGRLVLPTADDGQIVGQVTRPDGRPLPYVDVMLNGRNSPYLSADAFAGRDGQIESPALPAGRYEACPLLFFATNHPTGGLYTNCVENARVTAGKITRLAIRARRGAGVRGTVRSRSGRPLRGVYADYEQLGVAAPAAGGSSSDRHGRYSIYGVPAGRYAVCFSGVGFLSAAAHGPDDPTGVLSTCAHPVHVTLRTGRMTGGVNARLSPGGAISGRITDPEGRSFAHPSGIQLSIGADYVTVGQDGSFFAPGLKDGNYKVCATSYAPAIVGTSCAPARVKVVAGKISGGVHLVLNHAFRVVVHTVDPSGHALGGVDATLLAPCSSNASGQGDCSTQPLFSSSQQVAVAASGTTGSTGTTTLYAQKAGNYSLCVYGYWASSAVDNVSTGYGDACHDTTFGTAVGSGRVTITQAVAAGGAVTGRITDAAGHPIVGARISITNSGAADYAPAPNENGDDDFGYPTVPTPKAEARTDANGQYTIYSVAAGDQQVCATTPKSAGAHHACLAAPVSVTAGSTSTAPALTISS